MKAALFTAVAALVGSALADGSHHVRRHGHDAMHRRRAVEAGSGVSNSTCGCTTTTITYYGAPTTITQPAPVTSQTAVTSQTTTTILSTSYSTVTVHVVPSSSSVAAVPESVVPSSSSVAAVPESVAPSSSSSSAPAAPPAPETSVAPLPTPSITTFPTPGTYTIPATTLTVTSETTVCGATTSQVPSGTHTVGGVTTVVETSTTVICPYATVKPSGSTVTSVIETTTYVCPSAGTYTIAPITTYVPTSTVIVYPTPASFTPGTYTQPEQTVTVTETSYTYICPFSTGLASTSAPAPATSAPATSAPVPATSAPATSAPAPASSAPATSAPAPASSAPATSAPAPSSAPAETSSAAPSSSAPVSSSSAPAPSSTGGIIGGSKFAVTYSPYTSQGGCKAKSDVLADIAVAKQKGFNTIRIYSTDCSGLEFVGEAAKQNGLKLILGVFISSSGISQAQEQVSAIASWAQWELVSFIVIGNEAIQNGYVSAGDLAGFISSAKASLQKAGYSGEVTTTEPLDIWQEYGSTLCGAVDVVGANLHPFFNAKVTPSQAGEFVKSELEILAGICPGKETYNLETGWPNAGNANGDAVPGVAEQRTALQAIVESSGGKSVFFSYADDLWKAPGEFDVEQHWGCIDAF
ncbi:hypothetical protein MPDQ_002759 [Monascus purpureus]|uniref:Probable beta-glucosidase btgE n=1 Tax=Monascus purpureus TaxID=5098 RepID=A0A507R1S8_MONPU|nr:hypothetical protein MPDQ_002759 [Monascus purpureus]BDD60149.1 hypothetical protein MAP00_005307 [Monascus purpureus]